MRLTRDLIQLLSERTEDGYVFRTDLRLRPDPSATPLAISVEAAEGYYEGLGQNWERAAMIKARQVAGDKRAGERFLERLAPLSGARIWILQPSRTFMLLSGRLMPIGEPIQFLWKAIT